MTTLEIVLVSVAAFPLVLFGWCAVWVMVSAPIGRWWYDMKNDPQIIGQPIRNWFKRRVGS